MVVRDLTVVLERRRAARRAVDGLDLELGVGAHGMLGPNGAGKTTLMRVLATVITPTAGSVTCWVGTWLIGANRGRCADVWGMCRSPSATTPVYGAGVIPASPARWIRDAGRPVVAVRKPGRLGDRDRDDLDGRFPVGGCAVTSIQGAAHEVKLHSSQGPPARCRKTPDDGDEQGGGRALRAVPDTVGHGTWICCSGGGAAPTRQQRRAGRGRDARTAAAGGVDGAVAAWPAAEIGRAHV